jgi:hypothetical protein
MSEKTSVMVAFRGHFRRRLGIDGDKFGTLSCWRILLPNSSLGVAEELADPLLADPLLEVRFMTPSDWQRVKEAFQTAVGLGSDERANFLKHFRRTEPHLFRRSIHIRQAKSVAMILIFG